MFFYKQLTQDLIMHPSYFNQALRGHLGNELRRQVEGTCSGRLGYIVAVVQEEVDASGSHRGRIMEDGQAVFSIKYRAVVYRPFRNEVVDGVVSSVNKMGIFVDVGPLQCFISTHLVPPDFSFDPNSNPPCFSSSEDTCSSTDNGQLSFRAPTLQLTIQKGTKIRLKIVGTRIDATEIFAIGTIKEDYLGPLG
ncbi:hypothetical protein BMF94_4781 [Rhodotorula taiwanensis]|uniref:DNA-directed RNA polymerase II subunit RPB7 n=1 Tax=Rhodotorula taiwanensis TaxID=741276 RepID=A0A2S5B641_9BASI|nr:hypothetical protein BMF94_4781 [Rhodotorula taiwanensis]